MVRGDGTEKKCARRPRNDRIVPPNCMQSAHRRSKVRAEKPLMPSRAPAPANDHIAVVVAIAAAGIATNARPASTCRRKHRRHVGMDQVDCLERPDHDLEFDDSSGGIPLNDIDAVDDDAIDLGFKFQHGVGRPVNLAHIAKPRIAQYAQRGSEICGGQCLATLRRVHDGREEHHIVGQKRIEAGRVVRANELVPGVNGMLGHGGDERKNLGDLRLREVGLAARWVRVYWLMHRVSLLYPLD